MRPSTPSTKLDSTLRGLRFSVSISVCLGVAVACAASYLLPGNVAAGLETNLRPFASTVAQIGAGMAALLFAALALVMAMPQTSGLRLLQSSGHVFDLCARLGTTCVLWLMVMCAGLVVMILGAVNETHLLIVIGALGTAVASTCSSLLKLIKLVLFSTTQFDPDYIK